ncbi:MAG: hypothetical protein CYG60_15890 [Actinobacteria bacterium]|nr:MAG: hypothetical protein CYG60_15890 [Actinomycetota bacterium]
MWLGPRKLQGANVASIPIFVHGLVFGSRMGSVSRLLGVLEKRDGRALPGDVESDSPPPPDPSSERHPGRRSILAVLLRRDASPGRPSALRWRDLTKPLHFLNEQAVNQREQRWFEQ